MSRTRPRGQTQTHMLQFQLFHIRPIGHKPLKQREIQVEAIIHTPFHLPLHMSKPLYIFNIFPHFVLHF